MRKISEIRADLSAANEALRSAEGEQAVREAIDKVNGLIRELEAAETAEAAARALAERQLANDERTAGRRFSLLRMLNDIADGRQLSGLEADVAQMGADEYRRLGLSGSGVQVPLAALRAASGQNVTTPADGGNLAETMASRYVQSLRDNLPIARLGANILTDLVGTLPVITSQDITAGWGAEGAEAPTSKASYAKAVMSPKRNFANVATTRDLLRQTSFDVEADLIDKINYAHARIIEDAAINGAGGNAPTGILKTAGIGSVAMGTNGAAISWAKVVELESVVASLNALKGRLGYLTNAKVIGALKTTVCGSNTSRFILDALVSNMVNGYGIEMTNLVPANLTKGTAADKCSALIFGNWSDLYVGHWGGIDLIVDPYTGKRKGEIEICINCYNDVLVAEPKSFAAIQDILA